MATKILTTMKQKISGFELEPSGGGCFELTVNDKLVYSKLETGQFPDEEELVSEVSGMHKATQSADHTAPASNTKPEAGDPSFSP